MILLRLKRIFFLFISAKLVLPSAKQTNKVPNCSALSAGCSTGVGKIKRKRETYEFIGITHGAQT